MQSREEADSSEPHKYNPATLDLDIVEILDANCQTSREKQFQDGDLDFLCQGISG